MSTRPRLIGISGGSGSGKTTFARLLFEQLGDEQCAILTQDHYYIDQSARFTGDGESVNFDHPEALDFALLCRHLKELQQGRAVEVPIYDFVTHKRQPHTTHFPVKPVILLDGTLILSQKPIRDCLDQSIFVQTPEEIRFDRRLQRDVAERGRMPEGVHKQFYRQVKPMHDLYVEPSSVHADQLLQGTEPFDHAILSCIRSLELSLTSDLP